VRAVFLDAGEDIVIARAATLGIDVHQRAMDREQRDHVLTVVRNDQRVGLTGRLINVAARFGDPVMFEVMPLAADHVGMHTAGMPVPLQQARASDPQQVYVIPRSDIQVDGTGPDPG